MGTQTNIKFSKIMTPISNALNALKDNAFDPLKIELRKFSRIEPTGEPDYPGYNAVGKLIKVNTVNDVLTEVYQGESFGLAYLVGVPAYIYLNFFDFNLEEDTYSLLVTFDSSVLFHVDEKNAEGDVLERIVVSIVKALDIDVCGYNVSDRYEGEFDSITIDEILEGIRSGELLNMQSPFLYIIKSPYISTSEILSASRGTAAKYKMLGTYHILSAWDQ